MGVRILLADDHRVVRDGLKAVLERHSGWEVVGEAGDGHEALLVARDKSPDVAIVDVSMPRLNGVDATRRLLADSPGLKVLALTIHCHPKLVGEMLRAGASGYVLKDGALDELERAVRAVLAGEIYLSGPALRAVVEHYVRAPAGAAPGPVLTEREREVLQPLAEGKSTREISDLLHVSIKTVETHRKHIVTKLGLRSLAELTKYAIREGLTTLDLRG